MAPRQALVHLLAPSVQVDRLVIDRRAPTSGVYSDPKNQ